MSLDFEPIFKSMYEAMKPVLAEEWDDIRDYCQDLLTEDKLPELSELAKLRLDGTLTREEFQNEIRRETLVLEAQLQARLVRLKAQAQRALNKAADAFMDGIEGLL